MEGDSRPPRENSEPQIAAKVSAAGACLQELTRVWYALHEHYDLSCSYIVEYLPIASQREPVDAPPVLVAKADYAEILEER